MRAAARFAADLSTLGALDQVAAVGVDLYGSLAATGAGHGTQPAVLLGLEGYRPETIETEEKEARLEQLRATGTIALGGRVPIAFVRGRDRAAPAHGARLPPQRHDDHRHRHRRAGRCTSRPTSRSAAASSSPRPRRPRAPPPTVLPPPRTPDGHSRRPNSCSIWPSITASRSVRSCSATRPPPAASSEVRERLLHIRDVMVACELRGITQTGLLPGGCTCGGAPATGTNV